MTEMQMEIRDLDINRKFEYNASISVCLETLTQPGQGGTEAMVWDTDETDLLGCICKLPTMRSPCSQYIHKMAHTDTAYSVIHEFLCGCASAYLPYPHDVHRILGTSNCEDNPCICRYVVCDNRGLVDSYDNAMRLLYLTESTDALFREGMYQLLTNYINTTPANSLWSVIFDEPIRIFHAESVSMYKGYIASTGPVLFWKQGCCQQTVHRSIHERDIVLNLILLHSSEKFRDTWIQWVSSNTKKWLPKVMLSMWLNKTTHFADTATRIAMHQFSINPRMDTTESYEYVCAFLVMYCEAMDLLESTLVCDNIPMMRCMIHNNRNPSCGKQGYKSVSCWALWVDMHGNKSIGLGGSDLYTQGDLLLVVAPYGISRQYKLFVETMYPFRVASTTQFCVPRSSTYEIMMFKRKCANQTTDPHHGSRPQEIFRSEFRV